MPSIDLGLVVGGQGDTGDTGVSMRVRGDWNSGMQYVNDTEYIDLVYYKGSAYYCKNTVSGNDSPYTDTTNWGLIANGAYRIFANITLLSRDFQSSGNRYAATYHFPQGTFPQNVVVYMNMDQRIIRDAGIEFGGVQNSVVVIFCDHPSVFDQYEIGLCIARIYCDVITTEVVTPL